MNQVNAITSSKVPGSALPLLVAGAFFMENLDATVIVTAMPQMASAFAVHPIDMNIGISAYILTLTVFIPASGWIANRFGARNVFTTAMVIFTLASVLCALSADLATFTAARVLQGFGGAMMVPVGRLIVLRNTSKADLIKAIATITWPGLVAPILGPPVGGFLTTYASWHWIFILNVPLGIFGIWLAWRLIPEESPQNETPFDMLGFLLTGSACFSLMFGLELFNHQTLSHWVPLLCISASLLLGGLAVYHAKRQITPLIDLWALRIKSYSVTIWSGSLYRIAIGAVPFLLPLLFPEIPASKMGGANTFSNMIQQLAMGLGIAIGALALRIAEWFHPYRAGMIPLENFQIAFVVIGVVALLSIVDTLTLNRDAGDEVRKRPSRLK